MQNGQLTTDDKPNTLNSQWQVFFVKKCNWLLWSLVTWGYFFWHTMNCALYIVNCEL